MYTVWLYTCHDMTYVNYIKITYCVACFTWKLDNWSQITFVVQIHLTYKLVHIQPYLLANLWSCMFNPRLTKLIFVTQPTKAQIFKMNPRMMLILVQMVSLESPPNIDTKVSTNMPSIWLLWCHYDMRPHKNQEIWLPVQKYKKKLDFG